MKIQNHYPLKALNTFGIDVYAEHFATFSSVDVLEELLSSEVFQNTLLVLGGGSNILLTQNQPAVLKNEIKGIEKVGEDKEHVYIRAGAGENWNRFVQYCLSQQWAGIENLSLIPGNVGASPMQNIGAYGVEVKDVFHSLEAFHLKDRQIVKFDAKDCHFGYRESVFKNKLKGQFVITHVTYRLDKMPHFKTDYGAIKDELTRMNVPDLSIQAISQAVIHIRSGKLPDPAKIGNAGSFFKNPLVLPAEKERLEKAFPGIKYYPFQKVFKLAAGWLIEQCGWKGFREGAVGVHPKQALVLVNYGQANGKSIDRLSERIQESVFEKFGVQLNREVNKY